MLLASAVAVVHGASVLFMLAGALLALRWPRVLLVHAPVAGAILAINVAGADCPLTHLERWLVERAGGVPYRGGFLEHYLFAPLGLDVHSAGAQIGTYTLALGLNGVAYTLIARRFARGSRATPALQRLLRNPAAGPPELS